MRKESLEYLEQLVNTPSPSGFEQPAQELVRAYLKPYSESVDTDVMGNVLGIRRAQGKPRVLLAGHVDEIGFLVQYINDEGYIYFRPIGGVDPHLLPGQRMLIHSKKGPVYGVAGKKPIHLMEQEERDKVVKLHDQWIDIGVNKRKEAEKRIAIGDPVTFAATFHVLNDDLITGRGFDDKVGSFVVAETMRLLSSMKHQAAVCAVSTVQEELGLRGARTAAFNFDPQVGIAVDVGFATDFPGVDKKRVGETSLGKGPILHKGANINPVVGRRLEETARKHKIPYQMQGAASATGTDANVIQVSRSGVATALVSIPNRYMHTPSEVVSLKDLENAAKLLAAFIMDLKPGDNFTP